MPNLTRKLKIYWASEELDDPSFRYIAELHADTAGYTLVREDGSCNHIVRLALNKEIREEDEEAEIDLNPLAKSGRLIESYPGQGYAQGSSWSRGLAWALYGFTLSYQYTQNHHYLETARKVANYFLSHISKNNYISVVDFKSLSLPLKLDTSATTIAAAGLLQLAQTDIENPDFYRQEALKMLIELKMLCNKLLKIDGSFKVGAKG